MAGSHSSGRLGIAMGWMDPEMKVPGTPIQCNHCHTEIPATVALSFEGADYIYHFCGPQCIDAWCKATSAHDE